MFIYSSDIFRPQFLAIFMEFVVVLILKQEYLGWLKTC